MSRLIYIIVVLTIVSCKISKDSLKIKRILNSSCTSNTSISIKKDSLVILETFYSEQNNNEPNDFSFRRFVAEADTLVSDKFFHFEPPMNQDTLLKMRSALLFVDTISSYQFEYDKVPDTLMHTFNKNEEIVHFKALSGYWIYLCRNNQNAIWKLYVSKAYKEAYSLILPLNPEAPNFLLYDIVGDSKPEIFIFRNIYFMKRDLVDIDIFKINN